MWVTVLVNAHKKWSHLFVDSYWYLFCTFLCLLPVILRLQCPLCLQPKLWGPQTWQWAWGKEWQCWSPRTSVQGPYDSFRFTVLQRRFPSGFTSWGNHHPAVSNIEMWRWFHSLINVFLTYRMTYFPDYYIEGILSDVWLCLYIEHYLFNDGELYI